MLCMRLTSFVATRSLFTQAPWSIQRMLLHSSPTVTNHVKQVSSHPFSPLPHHEIELSYKPPLAGRKYLPGSQLGGFPEFLSGPQESFPKAYSIKSKQDLDIRGWAKACRMHIDEKLPKYSAILYRNLPLACVEDFSHFVTSLKYKLFGEGVTGYRTKLSENVHTSSDDPPEFNMELHNEASYTAHFPTKVIMFCVKEPECASGGETALLKNEDFQQLLDPNVHRKFDAEKICYQAFLPSKSADNTQLEKSWQDRFWESDWEKVEVQLKSLGYDYSWDEQGNLRYWYINPAFINHPVSGEKIWFNQMTCHNASYFRAHPNFENTGIPDDDFPFHSYYGDGTVIEPATLQHVRAASWSRAVGFQWRNGDVLVLDNLRVMHSRLSWSGQRQLVTSLADD